MRAEYNTSRFQAFVQDLQESFWGDFQGRTREALKRILEADSEQQMAEYLGLKWYERSGEQEPRVDSRNGYYERDYVTRLGMVRLRVRRTRKRSFLPRGLKALERRAPEVAELIRQAFLRGISTRQAGRVVAISTDEPVSAQTVSKLTRVLNRQVGSGLILGRVRRRTSTKQRSIALVVRSLRHKWLSPICVAALHTGVVRCRLSVGRERQIGNSGLPVSRKTKMEIPNKRYARKNPMEVS
jgi:hypothetical protein